MQAMVLPNEVGIRLQDNATNVVVLLQTLPFILKSLIVGFSTMTLASV